MKFFALALALASLSSHAAFAEPIYRIYEGEAKTLAQESKRITLKINQEVKIHQFGDAGIPDHGFIKRYLEVSVSEMNEQPCEQAVYLEDGLVRLCSGARLQLEVPQNFLTEKQVKGSLLMNGFKQPIGEVQLNLIEIKHGDDRSEDVD